VFCIEGGFEGRRVWMVLYHHKNDNVTCSDFFFDTLKTLKAFRNFVVNLIECETDDFNQTNMS
jgi:hypothetical protein